MNCLHLPGCANHDFYLPKAKAEVLSSYYSAFKPLRDEDGVDGCAYKECDLFVSCFLLTMSIGFF